MIYYHGHLVKKRMYSYPECPLEFTSCIRVIQHNTFHHIHHFSRQLYECNECVMIFDTRIKLSKHKAIHKLNKVYKCQICSCTYLTSKDKDKCQCG